MGGNGPTTKFDGYDLIPLKNMLDSAKPGRIQEVSEHWTNVHAELTQAVQDLQKAVEHATANWEGDAASAFTRKAGELQTKLSNTAAHAQNTSAALKVAGQALQQAQSTMKQVHVPGMWESGTKLLGDGFDRSDAQFKADLASGMNRIDAVNKNQGDLSATEIQHQYAIGVMEYLGPEYNKAAGLLDDPKLDRRDLNRQGFPPPPDNPVTPGSVSPSPMPTPAYPDSPSSGGPGGHATLPGGLPHGMDPSNPNLPTVPGQTLPGGAIPHPGGVVQPPSTGIDGWTPPTTTPAPGGGGIGLPGSVGGGTGIGGGGGTGGGGLGLGGGGFVPGGLGGGGGYTGGKGGGISGGGLKGGGLTGGTGAKSGTSGAPRPGSAGGAGGTGAGAGGVGGAGSGQGRAGAAGAGGMHGGGMGGGAGAGGKGAGGKSSGLVRKAGGTIGGAKPGGASGRAFTEGGSGLGKGRGANGAAGAGGMHGAGTGGAGKGKKKEAGHRPDYLVEDEDTWRGGSALPPVIE